MIDAEIEEFYQRGQEVARLFLEGRPRLELVRTRELLDRFLPPPPARVLDVGGGTGVYARALCARGHRVALVDPVSLHVDRARALATELGWGFPGTRHWSTVSSVACSVTECSGVSSKPTSPTDGTAS